MTDAQYAYGFACALENSIIRQGIRNNDKSTEQRERERTASIESLDRFDDWEYIGFSFR